jgi:site-specific recombinase XerC
MPTAAEVARVLKVSGRDREGFRDHVIISLAAGTGLRESEIVGLDVADVVTAAGHTRRVLQLRVFKRAGAGADPDAQRVHLPEATAWKLDKFVRPMLAGRGLTPWGTPAPLLGPLFTSRKGNRLSTRAVRAMWRRWQEAAGFDHLFGFHALRHFAISTVRRRSKDIRLAQVFARHSKLQTTTIYDHPGDEEIAAAVKDLPT